MRALPLFLLLLAPAGFAEEAKTPSAFHFRTDGRVRIAIAKKEIRQGVRSNGPDPRDIIRSILEPEIVPAKNARWRPNERVLGVVVNGEARAYQIRTLMVHELVNDVLGGVPIAPNY